MKIEQASTRMGLELPMPPKPVGSYRPTKSSGVYVFTSGQTVRINGIRRFVGKIGTDVTIEDDYLSARDACLNCLASLKDY